jgi:hypothetical protein
MTSSRSPTAIAFLVLALAVVASLFLGRVNVSPMEVIQGLLSPNASLAYFVVSGTMVVVALVVHARRFGRNP